MGKDMVRTKSGVNYQGIAFAKPFIEVIKKHIEDKPEYTTVTDYIRQATREKMFIEKHKWIRKEDRDVMLELYNAIDKSYDLHGEKRSKFLKEGAKEFIDKLDKLEKKLLEKK